MSAERSTPSHPLGLWFAPALIGLGFVLLPGELWSYLGGVFIGVALAMPK